jgi:hypothetical protein
MINAHIQCLKEDSRENHDKLRIIMPPQQMVRFLWQTSFGCRLKAWSDSKKIVVQNNSNMIDKTTLDQQLVTFGMDVLFSF